MIGIDFENICSRMTQDEKSALVFSQINVIETFSCKKRRRVWCKIPWAQQIFLNQFFIPAQHSLKKAFFVC